MRYHYPSPHKTTAGEVYLCDHPLYSRCTLFKTDDEIGLAIVQQHFNPRFKQIYWGPINPYLAGDILANDKFPEVFKELADFPDGRGSYPTVNVRSLMWELRMPPLEREEWEEEFKLCDVKSRKN